MTAPPWLLGPRAMPFQVPPGRAPDETQLAGATHWCRPGDKAWSPIDTLDLAALDARETPAMQPPIEHRPSPSPSPPPPPVEADDGRWSLSPEPARRARKPARKGAR